MTRHPRDEAMTRIERHRTGDMPPANSRIRASIEKSSFLKWTFKVVGVFGVALLLAGQPPPILNTIREVTDR